MASIQKKAESFSCQFLYQGRRYTFTIGKASRDEAESRASQVGYLLLRLRQGYLTLPSGVDIVTSVAKDGHVSAPEQKVPRP